MATRTEHQSTFLSKAIFTWAFPVIRTAASRRLVEDDFPPLDAKRSCRLMTATVSRNFAHFRATSARHPLLRALEYSCRYDIRSAFLLQVTSVCLDYSFVVPFYFLWRYLQDCQRAEPPSYGQGVVWIVVIGIVQSIRTLCAAHARYRTDMSGAEIRTALICLLSDKSLTVDHHAMRASKKDSEELDMSQQQGAVGPTFNLMSVDTDRVSIFFTGVIGIFRAILSVPLLAGIFGWLTGWTAAPMAGLLLCIAILIYFAILAANRHRRRANVVSDERVVELDNLFQGIRLIKFFGWEKYFQARLLAIRKRELTATNKSYFMSAIPSILTSIGIGYAFVLAYCIYEKRGDLDSPALVMGPVLIAAFERGLIMLNDALVAIVVGWPALCRVQDFLSAPDKSTDHSEPLTRPERAVELSSALFSWSSSDSARSSIDLEHFDSEKQSIDAKNDNAGANFELAPLTLDFPRQGLTAIVGPTQAGKSSLLSGLVGEMPLRHGQFAVDGLPSYCPQQAFIQSANVRTNIVFGQTYDEEIYDKVVAACALRPDFERFPNGDLSELGERGLNLSGGQKHRIHLARTIYQALKDDRKVVLLDDPLSAVDSRTCSIIFNTAILELLKVKCCLLVTHQLQILSKCDSIIFMKHGQIKAQGTFDELMRLDSFVAFVGDYAQVEHQSTEGVEKAAPEPSTIQDDHVEDEEEIADYHVPWSVHWRFLGSPGIRMYFILLITLLAIVQASIVLSMFQLGWWQSDRWHLDYTQNLALYLGFNAIDLCGWGPYLILMQSFMLHRSFDLGIDALMGMTQAPLSFFNGQPLGRLLQRFTWDTNQLDTVLPPSFWVTSLLCFYMLCLLTTSLAYLPLNATLLVPWALSGAIIFRIYKAVPLENKRISVRLSSKCMALLHEGLSGRLTINLAKFEVGFREILYTRLDAYNRVHLIDFATFSWATLAFDFSFVIVTVGGGLLTLYYRFREAPALLVVAYSIFLNLGSFQQNLLLQGTSLQKVINAIQRMQHFASGLPQETLVMTGHDQSNPEKTPWPAHGAIALRNVCLRYKSSLPLVLRNVSMEVKSCEKIGIVGRTGAGKSSLLMALLRMYELDEGDILIDGVDITKERGVHDVRHTIATIPQDPILFVGTIRYNLDPTGNISDERLLDALRQVHLIGEHAEGAEGSVTLDTPVESGGENLSAGQKQLLSLARALAKDNKIIVIDEATSNVDLARDQLVQSTIRDVFAQCTVLTIAHRLRTVLLYDRICVMGEGRVLEMGAPKELFDREGGEFRDLCLQAGITEKDLAITVD